MNYVFMVYAVTTTQYWNDPFAVGPCLEGVKHSQWPACYAVNPAENGGITAISLITHYTIFYYDVKSKRINVFNPMYPVDVGTGNLEWRLIGQVPQSSPRDKLCISPQVSKLFADNAMTGIPDGHGIQSAAIDIEHFYQMWNAC